MRYLPVSVGAAAVVLGLAAPAYADPADDDASFVAAVEQVGITFPRADLVVGAGKYACGLMDEGKSGAEVVDSVMEKNPELIRPRAAKFVAIATTVYCPQHLIRGTPNDEHGAEGDDGGN